MCLWILLDGPLTAPSLVLALRAATFLLRQHRRYLFHGYAAQLATGLQRPECVDTHPMKPAATLLDELYDSYISEQQRSIHNASLKHPAASFAHSRTELF